MRVLVFSTDIPGRSGRSAPHVILPDRAGAFLPQHPDGHEWLYFVTASLEDALFAAERDVIEEALASQGFYISSLPMGGLRELQT
jgi:hypothetical protein